MIARLHIDVDLGHILAENVEIPLTIENMSVGIEEMEEAEVMVLAEGTTGAGETSKRM